ncbi:LOW QUALITY PROTEIN: WD repeat-containing protein 54-like [Liolophura sinensis]|uniref:LOW QUALITY PROTEIN: WD repeat-containing protein 54-like n=1 Tax=Liolophura sinensis TaxID=3198878 RepID=UPI00315953B0
MYRREKSLTAKSSTSALCGNLSVFVNKEKNLLNYAVVHKSDVNIVSASTDGSTATHRQVSCKEPSAAYSTVMVMQAKWVELPVKTILVITSQRGILMYEGDGSFMLYWHAVEGANDEGESSFARGISGFQENTVCVGTYTGEILVFDVPSRGTNVTLADVLKGHKTPVCDITSDKDRLISSDEEGTIVVWKCSKEKLQQAVRIKGSGYPCSSLAVWKDIVVGGYGSGHIRIFSITTGKMAAEVAAHARWINSVDVSPDTGLVLSASEDSFVRVWQLSAGEVPEIQHKFSECVTDLQLAGGQFIEPAGRAFCVTGYDSPELVFFAKN